MSVSDLQTVLDGFVYLLHCSKKDKDSLLNLLHNLDMIQHGRSRRISERYAQLRLDILEELQKLHDEEGDELHYEGEDEEGSHDEEEFLYIKNIILCIFIFMLAIYIITALTIYIAILSEKN